ncbi:MAG: hypothetical protein ACI9SP_003631 [Arenicella sp.]|jgi:hypothetical protein
MSKLKLSLWLIVVSAIILVSVGGINYAYRDHLEKVCDQTTILTEAFVLPPPTPNRLPRIEINDIDSLILKDIDADFLEQKKVNGWLVYVPTSKENSNDELVSISVYSNTVTAEYYSHLLDYYLWLSKLVPEKLWDSYKKAIVYGAAKTSVSCSDASNAELANTINLLSASTGDLFNITAESTTYYIDEGRRDIIVIHKLRYKNDMDSGKTYYQGSLKAERADKLISLFVQGNDLEVIYHSLVKSSLSLSKF